MKRIVKLKRLTVEQIERSTEIGEWLKQFPVEKRVTATGLLLGLRFVNRDVYSEWLKSTLLSLLTLKKGPWAAYAIRKFKKEEDCLWDDAGDVIMRSSSSLGSEDLVNSVIANIVKSKGDDLLDHPSLTSMRERRPHHVALIDDSIGSGKRVVSFIRRMLRHPTFLSWWNYGLIRIYIVAFARTIVSVTPSAFWAVIWGAERSVLSAGVTSAARGEFRSIPPRRRV